MPKRAREDDLKRESQTKRPKGDSDGKRTQPLKPTIAAEVDFPRGGGSHFTPLETKAIHAEAVKELKDEQIFKDSQVAQSKNQKLRKRASLKAAATKASNAEADKDRIRVEHLNYKRISIGQRLLCQIVQINPLALIVSLPNQLLGHIPITHISSLFTERLERAEKEQEDHMDEDKKSDDDEEEDESSNSGVPELHEMFKVGQYLPAIVTEVRAAGAKGFLDISNTRDETVKSSRRVELSISPDKVNIGVDKKDLRTGFNISAAVKSVEDHGYLLDLGVLDVSGFLSLKEARKGPFGDKPLVPGQTVNASVSKMSENGRTITLSIDPTAIKSAFVSEVHAVTSVLPGSLVQGLVTAVLPWGLNVQILGFFNGTLDLFHLKSNDVESNYKTGQKIKMRVLWDVISSEPRTFALSVLPHIVSLSEPKTDAKQSIQDAFPVGTVLDPVKITRVESEWGLVCEGTQGMTGFVHISHVSDEHVPSLSEGSGLWKVGSVHRARVIGFSAVDGLLQLSLKPSIIDQKYLRASDVQVGEVIKGTIKSLSSVGLFVAISEEVDGVAWPLHYSDIKLKNPERKFKTGNVVKCRVLSVDSERNRINLTLKKSLVDSELPIIASLEDASVGMVTNGVVAKVLPKNVIINYYGGVKGSVPLREVSEENIKSTEGVFTAGQVVRTRIISVDLSTRRLIASIRQGAPNYVPPTKIEDIALGTTVSASVIEIQKDNVAANLPAPYNVRALLSINNLATKRSVTVAQLRSELKVGQVLEDLVVVSRNPEKGFVIVSAGLNVSSKNKITGDGADGAANPVDINTVQEGSIVNGRVLNHNARQGSTIRITGNITGYLHPTDTSDDFASTPPYPAINQTIRAAIVDIDRKRRRLVLSARPSRLGEGGSTTAIKDPELTSIEQLQKGAKVRGFVKSIADHGLFVSIGRGIDARVQIKELFDEYVKDWKAPFTLNQLIEGRILSVNTEKGQVELTLRSRDISQDDAIGGPLALSELVPGENVDGTVKKVESYGLFIQIKGSKLSGLCHKKELSDNKNSDVGRALTLFKEGDPVRARILTVDLEKRRVNFSLKPSYFADESPAESNDEENNEGPEVEGGVVDDDPYGDDADSSDIGEPSDDEGEPTGHVDVNDDDDDDEESDEERMAVDAEPSQPAAGPSTAPAPALKLHGGFQWGNQVQEGTHSEPPSSSDEENDDEGENTSKGRKKRKKHEIQKDFTLDMHTKTPESTADFERLLLGSPNSSFLWIQYMSFQLQLSEIDKAREIGRRALSAINFREEQEKLNVWIALLNLENTYGTDETLEAVFKDAVRYTDSKGMHLRLAAILDQTDKHEKAEELYKRTTKKFSQSSKVWTALGEHYLNRRMVEEARKLLPRSLLSLEKRKHLKTISKFAQLEYKLGDPERGKTIFEGIIDSHPKRLDLWSVYMDMEAVQKDINSLRSIFDRVFSQKLSSKKAKFFFKKWLGLERSIGDEEGAEAVKSRAIAWTQASAGP